MPRQSKSLARCLVAGLAVCAVAPAAAGAVPADAHLAGPPKIVHARPHIGTPSNLTAPDQVDRVKSATTSPAPVWPTGPMPRLAPAPTVKSPTVKPSDDGSDVGLIAALSAGGLLLLGGLGLAGRKHARQGQLA